MIIGTTATALTFITLIISITSYLLYHRLKDDSLLYLARIAFYSSAVLIFFQSALLMWGIINHHFEWLYVFSYSSQDLPLYYLISSFWAGQEGTFLLWLTLGSIYGLVIIKKQADDEPLVMSFMNLVQAFIVIILVKRNPFTYVWEANPAGFQKGVIPFDGNGLNPLLQDPWMTIHPPLLFFGYSATMILFAFAMSALVKKNYDQWLENVFPYALFVGLALGAGIILGGYWAYTTLGWGGYWGWDPVENSSLVPWLTALALIHGLIIQRHQGGLKKTNIVLALLTFLLVLYGSYLTRSGVLTNFSVHSFGTSELTGYLIALVIFFFALAVIFFLFRMNEVKSERIQTALVTRENFIWLGMIVLFVFAAFTFIGTSSPLITGIFSEASNVSIDYYNTIAAPLAILMALLMAVSPVLNWKKNSPEKVKGMWWQVLLSLLSAVIIYVLGLREMVSLSIVCLSLFIIFSNGELVFHMVRRKNFAFGGYLAHVGIALMLIGIITSSVYDQSIRITLPKDTETRVMGFDLSYGGRYPSADGKDKVMVAVKGQPTFAKFYWSDYSRAYMVAPSVKKTIFKDLYISPIQIIPAEQNMPDVTEIILKKNEISRFENYDILFSGYDMDSHALAGDQMQIAALLEIRNDQNQFLEKIKPALILRGEQSDLVPAQLPNSEKKVFIKGISVEQNSLIIAVSKSELSNPPHAGKELLAVEVSVKPLINILWLGTLILIFGFLVSLYNHTKTRKTE